MPLLPNEDRDITTRAEFRQLLAMAVADMKALASRTSGWSLPQAILERLAYVEQTTREGRLPSDQDAEAMMIGPIAVKNFDGDQDEPYRNLLCHIHYYYARYGSLRA